MNDKVFIDDMRTYRLDHLPDGWPAVQTQQIDRLIAIIDRLSIEMERYKTALKLIAEPDCTPDMVRKSYSGIPMQDIYEDIARTSLMEEFGLGGE